MKYICLQAYWLWSIVPNILVLVFRRFGPHLRWLASVTNFLQLRSKRRSNEIHWNLEVGPKRLAEIRARIYFMQSTTVQISPQTEICYNVDCCRERLRNKFTVGTPSNALCKNLAGEILYLRNVRHVASLGQLTKQYTVL